MQFWFSYPMSETQSYYLLQDNLVALYYQLYFLRLQCNGRRINGDGWAFCKYGEGVKCEDEGGVNGDGVDGTGCLSWICPVGKKEQHGNGKSDDTNPCGKKDGKASPLQAFLTDCLKGFTCPVLVDGESGKDGKKYQDNLDKLRKKPDIKAYEGAYPEFLSHRGHTSVFGQECAVPMGFSGSFRGARGTTTGSSTGMIGLGINAVLANYSVSNMETASLYQLTRCICSLTRRVPRSTGTLYGFFYYLGKMCQKNGGNNGQAVASALSTELLCCPGNRDPQCLMEALMGWTESDHSKKHTEKNSTGNYTLGSLHGCNNTNGGSPDPTCGYYLKPLTGSMYNSLATPFTETYVSWIVHLTGVLKEGLESLLEEFKGIKCSKDTCKGKTGTKECQCPESGCIPGSHQNCHCENVVVCAVVHPVLYRFGFTYDAPGVLGFGTQSERKCSQFYQQLEKVLTESPFKTLLEQLRNFIYSTRALFGVYIGVYWSIVLGYLLWSITGPLDLMHIQSHWKPAQSHMLPLQRILADGSRKGFCTLGYFQESGDRLLSEGISDVYL